jgi:hypothetical protein
MGRTLDPDTNVLRRPGASTPRANRSPCYSHAAADLMRGIGLPPMSHVARQSEYQGPLPPW